MARLCAEVTTVAGAAYFVPNPDVLHLYACVDDTPAPAPSPETSNAVSSLLKTGVLPDGGAVAPVVSAVAGLAYLLPKPESDHAYTSIYGDVLPASARYLEFLENFIQLGPTTTAVDGFACFVPNPEDHLYALIDGDVPPQTAT